MIEVPFADIDECGKGTHNCSNNALCHNVNGSYHCICKPYSAVYSNHGQDDGNDCIKTGEAYDYIFIFDNYIYQVFLYT